MGQKPGTADSSSRMNRVRIKIRGITRQEDAMAAVSGGGCHWTGILRAGPEDARHCPGLLPVGWR